MLFKKFRSQPIIVTIDGVYDLHICDLFRLIKAEKDYITLAIVGRKHHFRFFSMGFMTKKNCRRKKFFPHHLGRTIKQAEI